ncbi:MAG TPA: hypothetical protein DEQ61_08515, partial [Streptomyces sp.]|nr:hypothetical protein [Streptomyces sp.]
MAVRLAGELDESALRDALWAAAAADPALGECFTVTDGVPVPTTGAQPGLPLLLHDLSDFGQDERARQAEKLVDEAVRAPFDLAHGPLARACLIRSGAQDHTLVVVVHRMAGDHASVGTLLRDTAAAYRSAAAAPGAAPDAAVLPDTAPDAAVLSGPTAEPVAGGQ